MRKLHSWERLWVLASSLSLIPAVFFASASLPAISDIRHEDRFYNELSAEARAQLAQPGAGASEVTMPNGHVVVVQANVYLARTTPVLKEYNEIIAAALYRERAKFFGVVSVSWAALCLVLYFLGWTIAWAYRRLKPHEGAS
jgi:hypothetical protein